MSVNKPEYSTYHTSQLNEREKHQSKQIRDAGYSCKDCKFFHPILSKCRAKGNKSVKAYNTCNLHKLETQDK